MLSIIVCSRNSSLNDDFLSNIKKTTGVEYELICIDNSTNKYSISQAYNEGILRSKFQYLCFVHDDVNFNTRNWGEKVISHLNIKNTGLVGLAGGDVALKVLYDYGALNLSVNIIHVDKTGIEPTEFVLYPKHYSKPNRSVVLLDGVMFCAKRDIFEKISFDENMSRFHGYDYDISIQSIMAGYYNYVMYDISLTHYSKGNFDVTYYKSLIKVAEKWNKALPIFEHGITQGEQKKLMQTFERKSAGKLLKKLVRTKMKLSDIVQIYSCYTKILGSKMDIYLLSLLRLRIWFIRITSELRKKTIK